MDHDLLDLQTSYTAVADEYVERFFHELDHKPLERDLLDRFAVNVRGRGVVCDLGCGPGQIAGYLHHRGVDVCGIDLSPRMIELAQRLNPAITFRQGNMSALEEGDGAWCGIVAFYSIIHIPREEIVSVLREFYRVLTPGGLLLLSFHVGEDVLHLNEWCGKKVSMDFYFFCREEMEGYLHAAGFENEEVVERLPYADVEYQSRRVYIFARKPELSSQSA